MTVLLVVGVGVVVLGALVLLFVPDRPGGRIAWHGFEVSSIGAGLPLIVVGIAAIAIAGSGAIDDDGGNAAGGTTTAGGLICADELESHVAPDRVASVESGANAQILVGAGASKTEPIGLLLTNGGTPIGAMALRFFPASGVFKIQSLVDADCKPAPAALLPSGQRIADAFSNYRDLRIDLMGSQYLLTLNSDADIRVNFARYVP